MITCDSDDLQDPDNRYVEKQSDGWHGAHDGEREWMSQRTARTKAGRASLLVYTFDSMTNKNSELISIVRELELAEEEAREGHEIGNLVTDKHHEQGGVLLPADNPCTPRTDEASAAEVQTGIRAGDRGNGTTDEVESKK